MSEDPVLDIAKYLGTSEGRCWGGQKSGSDRRLQDLTCLISVALVEAAWRVEQVSHRGRQSDEVMRGWGVDEGEEGAEGEPRTRWSGVRLGGLA